MGNRTDAYVDRRLKGEIHVIRSGRDKNVVNLLVRRVLTLPDDEFAELTVSVLANFFHIDRSKLQRHFKRETNMNLSDFIFKEKMNRAAFLLKDRGDVSVKEVAQRIGFCTSDYFIKKFKEYYGIVPGEYKRLKVWRTR